MIQDVKLGTHKIGTYTCAINKCAFLLGFYLEMPLRSDPLLWGVATRMAQVVWPMLILRQILRVSLGSNLTLPLAEKYLFGTCLKNFFINHSHTVLLLYSCQYVAKRWGDFQKIFWRCCTKCYRTGRG